MPELDKAMSPRAIDLRGRSNRKKLTLNSKSLLVAIICILAELLFPALQNVREQARKVQ